MGEEGSARRRIFQAALAATPRRKDRGFLLHQQALTETEQEHLKEALELAERGRGLVSPNPLVGALIVKDGVVVGKGWHEHHGSPHAEVHALASCGDYAAGATMYLTLEPCCHEGKTPPCTDAIIEAGISRVVIASDDPTDKASGRGPGILRDEGLEVDWDGGDIATRARLINQPFRKSARCGRPHVIFKSAVTLDGKVATQGGDARWISGEDSRALVHEWRADVDAVCVGIGTVLNDDPMLTPKTPRPAGSKAARVVFDSEARLPLDSKLVSTVEEAPVIAITSRAASRVNQERLEGAGVKIVVASGQNEDSRVTSALQQLGAGGIQSVLLEGGPHLAGAFLDAGEVDEMRLFVAPLAVGGRQARVMVEGEGSETLEEGLRALSLDVERVGEDVLIRARMKEW